MDCTKTGKLILELRHRNNMTQADIARQLNISEQNPEVRFTRWGDGELYFYSTQHGLMKTRLSSR